MIEDDTVPELVSVCSWGCRFYREAAEVSQDSQLSLTLKNLESQRAVLAQELQHSPGAPTWAVPPLIPLVRTARDDQLILSLCERLDQETIAAYEAERAKTPAGPWLSLLDRHLAKISEGRARHAALLKSP